jgi:hypothetical protein
MWDETASARQSANIWPTDDDDDDDGCGAVGWIN